MSSTHSTTALEESVADVAALIQRHAWSLMDEDQRDALIRDVVLPRYMAVTTDGIQLGPSWWAGAVGATAESIRSRVKRLRQSQRSSNGQRSRALSGSQRHAKSVLRNRTQRRELFKTLDPDEREDLRSELTTGDLMDPDDEYVPDEHWVDKFIVTLGKTSREMEGRIRSAGGVILGSLTREQALKYIKDTERRVADVRAALQEQITEEKL